MVTPNSLQRDEIVLVTGLNGFVGSHIANEFLNAGFKVRGTVRKISKAANFQHIFDQNHGSGRFSAVEVPDITVPGAFDEAVKGVHAIAHSASDTTFSPDPNKVITPAVESVKSILESASKEQSVKNFILTSSSVAACRACARADPLNITQETWNEEDSAEAWKTESERGENHAFVVYGASKTEAELALWKFVGLKKPTFTIHSVLPSANFGPVISKEDVSSTGAFAREVYEGRLANLLMVPPQHYVSVEDTARLHVGPVLFDDVPSQRLFAWAEPFNWNDMLKVMRELRPKHEFQVDIEGLGEDRSTVTNEEAEKLLQRMGRKGWVSLKTCLEQNLSTLGCN